MRNLPRVSKSFSFHSFWNNTFHALLTVTYLNQELFYPYCLATSLFSQLFIHCFSFKSSAHNLGFETFHLLTIIPYQILQFQNDNQWPHFYYLYRTLTLNLNTSFITLVLQSLQSIISSFSPYLYLYLAIFPNLIVSIMFCDISLNFFSPTMALLYDYFANLKLWDLTIIWSDKYTRRKWQD